MTDQGCPPLESLLPLVDGAASLVAPELRAHLESCPRCKAHIAALMSQRTTMKSIWPDMKTQAAAQAQAARHPTIIGKYFIAGPLRGNGKYTVYRAAHAVLQEDVALQLGTTPVQPESARRVMIGEGKKLAQIDHPCAARVLDLDFYELRAFVVTQFVRGPAINDGEHLGPHTPQRSAAWISRLAEALAAAHDAGVWHLDIQPRHVRIDEQDQPRLLMLGSALLQQVRDGAVPEGDPAFLAPEQARGDRDRIGAASDMFSLGALLFHLLTGDVPYPGNNREQIRDAAREGRLDLSPLDRAHLTTRLRKLVEKTISSEPDKRPDDLRQWAKQLRKSIKPGWISRMLGS